MTDKPNETPRDGEKKTVKGVDFYWSARLSPIEQRVLAYLDQRGPTHRTHVVCDLASPESRIGQLGGKHNGSNGATPLIMGKWCKRLIAAGFVREKREYRTNQYHHHEITDRGRSALRSGAPQ